MKTVPIIDFGPHDGPAVCVVGSLNADLIAYESDSWIPGAYNVGERFELGAGGKGLNVAMSIAATGLPSYLVGRVGNDMFGQLPQTRAHARLGQPGLREDRLHGVHRGRARAGQRRTATTTPASCRAPMTTSTRAT